MIRYTTLDNFQHDNQPLPSRGSDHAAGIDLSAAESAIIRPGDSVWIRTGIAFELHRGLFGQVCSRSGLHRAHRIVSFPGIIDPDYRGEIMVNLTRDWYEAPPVEISIGQRIAQILIQPYHGWSQDLLRVNALETTTRGENGFGSSGK